MDLIPDLQIGLWNAWLPLLSYFLFTMIFSCLLNKEGFKRGGDRSWLEKKDKITMTFSGISYIGILVFSIWVPLKSGTILFFVGFCLYVIGVILSIISSISFVTAPMDKPIAQGIYRFSRNPIYVVNAWMVVSIALLSGVWILFLMLAIYLVSVHFVVLVEERYCRAKYGDAYRQYLEKTPRYFLFF